MMWSPLLAFFVSPKKAKHIVEGWSFQPFWRGGRSDVRLWPRRRLTALIGQNLGEPLHVEPMLVREVLNERADEMALLQD
jgi:hypothetical protein